MNTLITAFKTAISGLKANKGRAILTTLGIVIGIALVIIVMSAGSALEVFIGDQISSFGPDFIEVEIKVPGTMNPVGVTVTTLTQEDADAVFKLPNIKKGYAGVLSQSAVSANSQTKKSFLFAVNSTFPNIDPIEIADGRFFDASEEASLARVVVLGKKIKESLFGQDDAIGKYVRMKNSKYKVIGVAKERGAVTFFDYDELIYMPLKTLQKRMDGINHVSFLISATIDSSKADATKKEVEALMRERHKITDPEKDDFIVTTMADAQEIIGVVLSAIQLLLIALASISLIVGGVGIMNIMYVSVSERTYEIGLRKAIGAKNRSILTQFLMESVVMTALGGVIGIIIGGLIAFLIAIFASAQGFNWPFIISINSILLSVSFSVAIGVIFGLYPARKASKLNPIEALRYE
ncbi:MAG: multidrug ABC transporter substrate-binding protein [Candidatus Harrisonbacteria bacterium CG10_big_fil_rev_8_21_14_0_10_45_28]|uniref:Multidrug ABC transporter substrate-binding protein n=1 Tax=Candidatus Harrisonbacteria bacterium CG10_big_fil_rev_8_21_14_0_10_45_28 TaxID=1974586 RepID=A0A2H0UPG6_9BACT|nr:MAG: multidrug ABC transporter substrate-binding protein [Candidatus Harrisonbacteria bacterium CG10_big_fil_rev_8_21_14_0_10_45_28]